MRISGRDVRITRAGSFSPQLLAGKELMAINASQAARIMRIMARSSVLSQLFVDE
jgi:hypothetical protein